MPLDTATRLIEFNDSTDPTLIPQRDYAALYRDGLYGSAGLDAAPLFKHVRWITIAAWWQRCGIADFEPGNPVYEDPTMLPAYLNGRQAMDRRGRIYCDRADTPLALERARNLPHEWWIAAWTGPNGEPGYRWTAAELAADIARVEHVEIGVEQIWAIQFIGGPGLKYDTSVLCAGRTW